MSDFVVLPMVWIEPGRYSVPDELLLKLWERIEAEGREKWLFWGGSVKTAVEFLSWIRAPGNYPVIVVDRRIGDAVFLAWLNNYADGVAMAHFCGIGRTGRDPRRRFSGTGRD